MKFIVSTLLAGALMFGMTACEEGASTDSSLTGTPAAGNSSVATAAEGATAQRNPVTPRPPKFQAEAESLAPTSVEFVGEVYDFGEVPEGTKVTHQFKFTNTGEQDLKITNVKASCGCTTPSYSQEAIAPGAEGYIDVEFDSSGKPGFQNKSVTVTGNFADGVRKVLRIKGQVKAADA